MSNITNNIKNIRKSLDSIERFASNDQECPGGISHLGVRHALILFRELYLGLSRIFLNNSTGSDYYIKIIEGKETGKMRTLKKLRITLVKRGVIAYIDYSMYSNGSIGLSQFELVQEDRKVTQELIERTTEKICKDLRIKYRYKINLGKGE